MSMSKTNTLSSGQHTITLRQASGGAAYMGIYIWADSSTALREANDISLQGGTSWTAGGGNVSCNGSSALTHTGMENKSESTGYLTMPSTGMVVVEYQVMTSFVSGSTFYYSQLKFETEAAVTASPTSSPTGTPTTSPVATPTTENPTSSPISTPVTDAPTRAPVVNPPPGTNSPTKAPVTSSPVASTSSPTVSPVGDITDAPSLFDYDDDDNDSSSNDSSDSSHDNSSESSRSSSSSSSSSDESYDEDQLESEAYGRNKNVRAYTEGASSTSGAYMNTIALVNMMIFATLFVL